MCHMLLFLLFVVVAVVAVCGLMCCLQLRIEDHYILDLIENRDQKSSKQAELYYHGLENLDLVSYCSK